MKLNGKVAVVTGAGSGIGQATALLFAAEGARVACVDINEATAKRSVEQIEKAGGQGVAVSADVSTAAGNQAMVERALAQWGRLDILYANAGVPQSPIPVEELDEALFDRIMAVNVKGVFLGVKHAVPVMKRQGSGVILITASTAAIRPRQGIQAYGASKGAVIALTKALALELARHRIRVVAIAPVATDTPMLPAFMGKAAVDDKGREAMVRTIPLGRLNTPEDIARAALFLASDDAAMVTGTCVEVDGGRCL
ncbi:MAG: SDR family oxidoreductase [Candidatus Rokubacteria bacterium]|nr:SDR family oxidoreductase [Candidatus Rokubacteria bacterium]